MNNSLGLLPYFRTKQALMKAKFLVPLAATSLLVFSCNDPAEDFIEEPADNVGICWECDELPKLNSQGLRLWSTVLSGYYSYSETYYYYDDQGRYAGWEDYDYLTESYSAEWYEYDAQGDLFEVTYTDGVDSVFYPASKFETNDTIYLIYNLLEYRYAKADGDDIPELVVEYDDYDYLKEWQRYIYTEVADGEIEIWNVLDGDTTFSQKFTIDDKGRILSYTDDPSYQSIYYKYFGEVKNPYPKPPYPTWLPYVEYFSIDPNQFTAKVLYNGEIPQMLVDATGDAESDTLYFNYELD